MNIQAQILIGGLVSWLAFPVIGIIAGILAGRLYRKENIRVDTDSKKPSPLFIGGVVGILIVIIGHIGFYIFWPAMQGAITADYVLRTAVVYLFYLIFAELFWVQIANGKKTETNLNKEEE